MSIKHRFVAKYPSRNHEIVARLRTDSGAAAPVDPRVKVKRLTAQLSCEMALLHGGDWRVQIDHDVGLIVIARLVAALKPRRNR